MGEGGGTDGLRFGDTGTGRGALATADLSALEMRENWRSVRAAFFVGRRRFSAIKFYITPECERDRQI
jgi:hypothetical protein